MVADTQLTRMPLENVSAQFKEVKPHPIKIICRETAERERRCRAVFDGRVGFSRARPFIAHSAVCGSNHGFHPSCRGVHEAETRMLCILRDALFVNFDSSRNSPKIQFTYLRFVHRQEIINRTKAHSMVINSAILIHRIKAIRSSVFRLDPLPQGQQRP